LIVNYFVKTDDQLQ